MMFWFMSLSVLIVRLLPVWCSPCAPQWHCIFKSRPSF
jgi:hypothetical protein